MSHIRAITARPLIYSLQNEANKGNEVRIEIRPKGRSAVTALVNIEGDYVAKIRNTEANDVC